MLSKKKCLILLGCFILLLGLGYFVFLQKNEVKITKSPQEKAVIENEAKDKIKVENDGLLEEGTATDTASGFSISKQDIGQMLIVGFRGLEVSANSGIGKQIKDLDLGGVILFDYDVYSKTYSRNIETENQIKQLIASLKKIKTDLFISVDVEGGMVNRLKNFLPLMSAKELGESPESAQSEYARAATKLAELGFNMNFAPVLDININPENPVIGAVGRSYSADPQAVAEIAEVFIKALQAKNIISVAKHFPGHGSSQADSHLGLVDITESWQKEVELLPYKLLQGKGLLSAVMTAHIINKNIDNDFPATLSSAYLKDILQGEIGFSNVVVSDDMQMQAITEHYGFKQALVLAINAGCDILILSNNSKAPYDANLSQKAVDAIWAAVQEGTLKEARLKEALNKIAVLKRQFSIIQ